MNRTPKMRTASYAVMGALLCVLGCTGASKTDATRAGRSAPVIHDGVAVQMDYTLTVDGRVVDSSRGKTPLRYVQGRLQIIPGLERQLAGLRVGDAKDITVSPDEGYGRRNPQAVVTVSREKLPSNSAPQVGMMVGGQDAQGRKFQATITEVHDKEVVLDLNHPLAGKTLHFNIRVVNITPVT